MGDLSKNFSRYEFTCKCGCGFDKINPKIVELCQELRDFIGEDEPIIITSGCRCETHNKDIGSTSVNHIHGNAADMKTPKGHRYLWYKAKELYEQGGLQGVELVLLEGNWVHMDVDRKRNKIFQ